MTDYKARERNRNAVFNSYGRICACCGAEKQLCVDHIIPWNENSRSPRSGTQLYEWLISNDFPPDFQTLCYSCNKSKGASDHCNLAHGRKLIYTSVGSLGAYRTSYT